MRSDYALYVLAIIFFIFTAIAALITKESEKPLWVIATTVLGLFFMGLGYSQRPREKVQTTVVSVPPSTQPTPPPTGIQLTEVKGIGEKRAGQLKAIGINDAGELAKASAMELASKLKISQKIAERWIENAKKLVEKS
ncbi:MAG: helix-hairpin-helix domain-containing protein [Candidatus Bathyarchaeia archaeon]